MTVVVTLLYLSAASWIGAALITGMYRGRFPPEFPLFFVAVGLIRLVLALVSTFERGSALDILAAAILSVSFILPLALLIYLFTVYPETEPPRRPRRLGFKRKNK